MKTKNFLLMGLLPMLALTACTSLDDNSEWRDTSNDVDFTAYISGLQHKATGTNWANGDRIGIFMAKSGTGITAPLAANNQYITDASGRLTAADANNALSFPEDGSAVDFVAYYPYSSTGGTTYAVDVTDQTSQPAIDLLYSDNAKNVTSGTVNLGFSHQLSKVVLDIQADATIPTTAGLQVQASNVKTQGNFDLSAGTLAVTESSTGTVTFQTNETGTQSEAILLPTTDSSNITLRFTLNGQSVDKTLNTASLAAGSSYTIPVKLGNSGGSVYVQFGNATISPWTDVPCGDLNVDFNGSTVDPTPDPDPQPGTETTIFSETFGTLDTSAGGTSTYVSNYTGYDNYGTLTFTNPYDGGKANIRTTKTFPTNHLWLPANYDNGCLISGINAEGYTNIKLTYDITANLYNKTDESDLNVIKVKWNGTEVTVPSQPVSNAAGDNNKVYTLTLTEGFTAGSDCTLEFYSAGSANTVGFRIDNIKLVGTK